MSFFGFFTPTRDISHMTQKKDIAGLLRLLRSHDAEIQLQASHALSMLGNDAVDALIVALKTRNPIEKLGIIYALSEIRSPRAVIPLIAALTDENSEVRWQAAIGLGDIGEPEATDYLFTMLSDPDKYVRNSAAISLTKIGWKPKDVAERAYYFVGLQEWGAVKDIGEPSVPALTAILSDRDSSIRAKAVELIGEIGGPEAVPAIIRSLGDESREVRWNSVLASPKSGISLRYLPRGLSKRPQNLKNPFIAGFLNFLLPGLGYGYLGKWWGVMIFQIDIILTVWLFKYEGDFNSYAILFPVYLLLGVHAWHITTKMPKDPP